MRLLLLSSCSILFSTGLSLAQAPGGVTTNLTSWFLPDVGYMTLTGVDVSDWNAQAGGIDVTEATVARQPDHVVSDPEFNFGHYVEFDGTNDALNNAATGDLLGTDGYIFLASGHINGINHLTFHGPNANYQVKGLRVGYQGTNGNQWQILFNTMPTPASPLGRPVITAMKGGATAYCRRNGNLSTTQTNPWGAQVFGNLALGQRGNYSEFCNYRMSEFLTYDGPLTPAEINQIESYLAVKYGITLGINGTSQNYTSSLGTITWDVAANAGYNWDIAGIGRDDNSLLSQLKSHSINGPVGGYNDIVTLAHGNNFAAPGSLSADDSFLIWGHDNMNLDCQNTDVGMTLNGENVTERIAREWKAQETGTVGLTTIEFDMTNSTLGSWGFSDYKLLVDGDGDFTNGTTSISPSLVDVANNKLYFEHDFDASTGFFFTLGVAHATVSIAGSAIICAGDTTNLTFSIVGASGPIDVTYDDGTGPITITGAVDGQQVPVFPTSTTTYSISAVMSTTCYTNPASSATVTVDPTPTVTANATTTVVCTGDMVTLSGSGTAISYTWDQGVTDGVAFIPAATADYVVTGVSAAGCQNTDTITVSVGSSIIVTANVSQNPVCPGDTIVLWGTGADNYSWDNSVTDSVPFAIQTTTTFNVSGTSLSGCTGADQITVTVHPAPSVQANATSTTICAGDLVTLSGAGAVTYTWDQGVTDSVAFSPLATAQYMVQGVDANGCEAFDSVSITVNPLPTVVANTSNDTICEGDQVTLFGSGAVSYTWDNAVVDGISFSPATTQEYVVTGTDANGCMDSDSITVEVIPAFTVTAGNDQTICDGASITLNASVSNGASITWNNGVMNGVPFTPSVGSMDYVVTATLFMCSVSDTMTITVDPLPTFTLSSTLPTSCGGMDGTIVIQGLNPSANYAIAYMDSSAQGPLSMASDASGTITITGLGEGYYSDIAVSLGGCLTMDSTVLDLTVPNNVSATFSNPDTVSICSGDSVMLNINLAGNAPWTLDLAVDSVTLPQLTGLTAGNYSFYTGQEGSYSIIAVSDADNCQGALIQSTVVVEHVVVPGAPSFSGLGTYCSDAIIPHLIAGGTGGPIQWFLDSNMTQPLAYGDTLYNVHFDTVGEFTFWAMESNQGCPGEVASAAITLLDAGYIIVEDTVHVCLGDTAVISPYSSDIVYWDGPGGQVFDQITLIPDMDTVLLGWMNTECGLTTQAVWVFVHPIPVVDAGPDQTIVLHQTAQITAFSSDTAVWTPGLGLSCTTCLDPMAAPLVTSQYILTATSEYGCENSDTIVIYIDGEWEVFVPNIFSPNDDGWNDLLLVQGPEMDDFHLDIYNRWGEKVFSTNDILQVWDGTWRGQAAGQSVYAYRLRARITSTQTIVEQSGNITLVR